MMLGMSLFIALLLLKGNCPFFTHHGARNYLEEIERVNVKFGNERINFGEILGHTSWQQYRRNYRPRSVEHLVVVDRSVSLDEHEKLTGEIVEFLDQQMKVSVTLIRSSDEDCDKLQDSLTHSSRRGHENLKLMYTCLANRVHKLISIDAQLSGAKKASSLSDFDKRTTPETVFAYDEEIGSKASESIPGNYKFCPNQCKLYCTEPMSELANVTIGAFKDLFEISVPSNLTIDATDKISHPPFGSIICLDCDKIQHKDVELSLSSIPESESFTRLAIKIRVTVEVALIVAHWLLIWHFISKLMRVEPAYYQKSSEFQWIIKHSFELLVHTLYCLFNFRCSFPSNLFYIDTWHKLVIQALISWLLTTVNVIWPLLHYTWPSQGLRVACAAIALGCTGWMIRALEMICIDRHSLLPQDKCSIIGSELIGLLSPSTTLGMLSTFSLLLFVVLAPLIARFLRHTPSESASRILHRDLTICLINNILPVPISMKKILLKEESLLPDPEVYLIARLIITMAVLLYVDCRGHGTEESGTNSVETDQATDHHHRAEPNIL